ncbi:MAG: hypothetical protein WBE75_00595 [Candidatus Omnitrophota bacterium]|jgi:hypothetical protein
MEKAVMVNTRAQLRLISFAGYDRLYFGSEFCQKLIPEAGDLKEAFRYARGHNLSFSLLTPYVTNKGIRALRPLFEEASLTGAPCEVIVNDWGVLRLLNRRYGSLVPVLGRLLTKQKRSPELERLLSRSRKPVPFCVVNKSSGGKKIVVFPKQLPRSLDAYYKGSNVSSVAVIQDFLTENRVARIELDNTAQGLHLELGASNIAVSLYLPYVYISTTFLCPTAGCAAHPHSHSRECRRECGKYFFKLRHKAMPKIIYLKGNSLFYKNSRFCLEQGQRQSVNRIVYCPDALL